LRRSSGAQVSDRPRVRLLLARCGSGPIVALRFLTFRSGFREQAGDLLPSFLKGGGMSLERLPAKPAAVPA